MRRALRGTLVALTMGAVLLPLGQSAVHAQGNECPGPFVEVPADFSPSADRNGDGIVCVKNTPGVQVFIDNNAAR